MRCMAMALGLATEVVDNMLGSLHTLLSIIMPFFCCDRVGVKSHQIVLLKRGAEEEGGQGAL